MLAIYSETFSPGNWPPSPGLAPCAILIWISSAEFRYSAVTPKRPDATCLIFERRESPSCNSMSETTRSFPRIDDSVSPFLIGIPASSFSYRLGSSPPSPVLDLPPIRFIAIASEVCASVLIDPSDMAPVANRLTISFAGSTSSIAMACTGSILNSNKPRKVIWRRDWSLMIWAYSLYVA